MKRTRRKEEAFTALLERSTNRLWGCHFRVPPEAARRLRALGTRRVVCTLNGAAAYQCAMLPFGNGTFVIAVNKQLRTRLGIDAGASVEVRLATDVSRYGLPVPAELAALWRQDAEGRRLFETLTPGRKRTLLYMVGKPDDPDERIRRALVITRHLKANAGAIDYRRLYGAMRNSGRGGPGGNR